MKAIVRRAADGAERARMWLMGQRWFTSALLPALPRWLRWLLRKMYLGPIDAADRLLGSRQAGVPPKAGTFTGPVHDFAQSGQNLVDALRDVAAMTPSSHILDVGCGVGRFALPMTRFLAADGAYDGLDIVQEGIEWCRANIVGPHGNLHFTLADIRNKEYNPHGRVAATDYRFPYNDGTFDVAVLVSVFTHMLPVEVDHYLAEISRVLKPGGRIFSTNFLLNRESVELMNAGAASLRFKHNLGSHWIVSRRVPELAIGYDERFLLSLYRKHGFSEHSEIYRGAWCGRAGHWPRDSGLGDQDTVVATKT